MRNRVALGVAGLVVTAAAVWLTGCGQGAKGPDGKDGAGKKLRLAGIIFQEDEFFHLVQKGMAAAAKEAGAEFLAGNSNNKIDKEIRLVNTYANRGVDALVLSPLDPRLSVKHLERAHGKGVPIVLYNTGLDADFPVATLESDQAALGATTGKAAVRYITEKLGGKAKIAILAFKSQAPIQSNLRVNGFKKEVSMLPGVEIVSEQEGFLAAEAQKRVDAMLSANPDINVIWAANEGGTYGAVRAVEVKGRAGQVVVFGTDANELLCEALLDNNDILQTITAQQPYKLGTAAVRTALAVLKGRKVEKKIIVDGVCLSRTRPDEVKTFLERLRKLMAE